MVNPKKAKKIVKNSSDAMLLTADGWKPLTEEACVSIASIPGERQAIIAQSEDAPCLASMGRLIEDDGYSVEWDKIKSLRFYDAEGNLVGEVVGDLVGLLVGFLVGARVVGALVGVEVVGD